MRLPSLRALIVAFVLMLLTACASQGGRLVSAGAGLRAFDLQLDSSMDWARIKRPRAELWTIDGLPLNQFVIISRVRANEHVFLEARERRRRPDGPWFRPDMRPDEIRDVILDGLRQEGWARVTASNLRPARFGSVSGLRFEARLTHQNGLHYQGTFAAAVHDGRLTHFFWLAPTEHYYGRDIAAVNAMFDSARFLP